MSLLLCLQDKPSFFYAGFLMSASFPIKFTLVAIDYLIHVVNMMTEYKFTVLDQPDLPSGKRSPDLCMVRESFHTATQNTSFLSDWVLFGVSTFAPFFSFSSRGIILNARWRTKTTPKYYSTRPVVKVFHNVTCNTCFN